MKKLKTIEVDRYEKMDDGIHIKHVGMIKAKDAFKQLETHLEEVGLLPDEYFSPSYSLYGMDDLPDYRTAICHVDWGGNEGIYLDISMLHYEGNQIKLDTFATGKTLDSSGEAFLRMSRIAAECSMMLNGRGTIVRMPDHAYEADTMQQTTDTLTLAARIDNAQAQTISGSPISEKPEVART